MIGRLVSMELHAGKGSSLKRVHDLFRGLIYKESDPLDFFNLSRNRMYIEDVHLPGTRSKDESQGIGPGSNRKSRVLNVGGAANFDPGAHAGRFGMAAAASRTRASSASSFFNARPGCTSFMSDSPIKNAWYPASRRSRIC